jgi:hypothetical protein
MSRESIVTCNLCKATTSDHFDGLKGWKHIEIREAFEFSRAVGKLLPKPAGVRMPDPITTRREGLL